MNEENQLTLDGLDETPAEDAGIQATEEQPKKRKRKKAEIEQQSLTEILEKIVDVEYSDVMSKSYVDYSMSVITSRAIPDIRDGLKPVQRRILYDMHELGLASDKPYRKVARVVGDTMSKFHAHGLE